MFSHKEFGKTKDRRTKPYGGGGGVYVSKRNREKIL